MSEDKEITLAWVSSLRLKISYLLREIITEPDVLDAFLSEKAMAIWARAFTHESFDYEGSYEELEFLGDAILHAIFPVYLFRRYPGLKKSTYSNMNAHYMSKAFQPVLAARMNLDSYVRVGGALDSNLKINTDLFESFFGALYTVANIIQDFYGYAICTVMLEHILLPLELDTDPEPAKTRTLQIFTRLGLGDVRENVIQLKNKVRLEIYLTDTQLQYLASEGIRIPALIANGEGGTVKSTSNYTYQQALQTLEKYGVTKKWVSAKRLERDLASDLMKPYIDRFRQKIEEEGFVTIDFENPSKTLLNSKGMLVQLLGIYPDGKKKILASQLVENIDKYDHDRLEKARAEVVRLYLEE